jgi:hypothetical protein
MGWWVGDIFHIVDAHAHHFSSGGALILTSQIPPHDHVWIALSRAQQPHWHRAKVVRVSRSRTGVVKIGLASEHPGEFTVFQDLCRQSHWV